MKTITQCDECSYTRKGNAMQYDYLKHTLKHIGKTCKRLNGYFDDVKSDITIGCFISIKIEVQSKFFQYNRKRYIEINYQMMNMSNYLHDLIALLKAMEVELIEENFKIWNARYKKEMKDYEC